ncbi:UNVERIFIED_CONTAM: hypothetical protein Sindi_2937600 [Sesamum indicum]
MIDIRFLRPWARHLVTEDETIFLLSPFTSSDVKEAVFDIAEDKAPGPDGYSSGFFKAAWPIVGGEVTRAVLDFFTTGRLLKQINTTLLALIPKVHSPMSVGDFRPISCCNVLYKIIAKLIVKRLSVVLDKVISPCQAAFVPGRKPLPATRKRLRPAKGRPTVMGVRRTTVIVEQFSGETREIQLETEKSPLKEVRLEETAGDSVTPHCCHGHGDGIGSFLEKKTVDLAPSSSFSELGFCAVGEDEPTLEYHASSGTFLGIQSVTPTSQMRVKS